MWIIATRTAQRIFEEAVKKAGVEKDVSVHSLRHSFATHLRMAGQTCGIFRNCAGTRAQRRQKYNRYMSNKDFGRIKSPLDSMEKNLYLEDRIEGHENQQSHRGMYVRSKFRISFRFVWIYDVDVGYTEVMCNSFGGKNKKLCFKRVSTVSVLILLCCYIKGSKYDHCYT